MVPAQNQIMDCRGEILVSVGASLEQVRLARSDDEELRAVLAALDEKATVHQITSALGISDGEFGAFLASRAVEVTRPTQLEQGDLVVSTQLADRTLIRVARPYRRPVGSREYSAEVLMPGNRQRQLNAAAIEPWFPVKVVRVPKCAV